MRKKSNKMLSVVTICFFSVFFIICLILPPIINLSNAASASSLIICDLNGDNKKDILQKDASDKIKYTTDLTNWTQVSGTLEKYIACGDLNADGANDIIGMNNDGSIWFTTNLGSNWQNIPGTLSKIFISDMNGDGKSDILGLNEQGDIYITYNLLDWSNIPGVLTDIQPGNFNASRSGNEFAGINTSGYVYYTTDLYNWTNIPGSLARLFAGEINGDGRADLMGLNSNNEIYYTTNLQTWTNIPGGLVYIITGDVNGDEKNDIIGLNSANNVWHTTDMSNWINIPGELTSLATGDLNNDGKADIAGAGTDGNVYYTTDLVNWVIIQDTQQSSTTYYVRTDGGTAGQCNGLFDTPYPGSGTNQNCAWSHPFFALNNDGSWKIKGSETLMIDAGSYMMGFGAPNTSWCSQDYTWDCVPPPLPSGSSQTQTKILGKGWNQGCQNPPKLWGTQRANHIIDLTGTSNAMLACLEITDHSSCVEFHSKTSSACERDTFPYGDWASVGIIASDSSNITLKNLNIHGLANRGILAARLSNWTVEDVRIAANGSAGWDGDIDGDDSNSGNLTFKRWIVEWNGCAENYPDLTPADCWAQTAGGYGDGVGTGTTGGNWIIEDSVFRYNTSDGLDLLYARNPGSQITIRRTMAYGNAGNQIKTNGSASLENVVAVGNCGYFNGKSFTYNVDDCRAAGNTLSLSFQAGSSISLVNSTVLGHGDCLGIVQCDDQTTCNGSEKANIINNIFYGGEQFGGGDTTCWFWFDNESLYNTQIDYNIIYNTKESSYPVAGSHDLQQDPLFINSNLENFNLQLTSQSPAINNGLGVGSLGLIPSNDINLMTRPSGAGVDRGAYEYFP